MEAAAGDPEWAGVAQATKSTAETLAIAAVRRIIGSSSVAPGAGHTGREATLILAKRLGGRMATHAQLRCVNRLPGGRRRA